MKNQDWQEFERKSIDYLNSQYGKYCNFTGKGGHDSTEPDIIAEKNGTIKFCIEAKSGLAQCGQFVLTPNFESEKFVFSSRNKSPNAFAYDIIEYMNKNFSLYSNPSSKGEKLDIPQNLIYNWIYKYYTSVKNTLFFISEYNNEFIICHIQNLLDYFNFGASYRVKISGSSCPSKKNIKEIIECLNKRNIIFKEPLLIDDKCIVEIKNKTSDKFVLHGNKYRFQFSREKGGQIYTIRRLSNTNNANVIFTIESKKNQQDLDVNLFLEAIE